MQSNYIFSVDTELEGTAGIIARTGSMPSHLYPTRGLILQRRGIKLHLNLPVSSLMI